MTDIVGIINVTPDSFSDGGEYRDAAAALRAIDAQIKEGAAVIDIGAESTRPGAIPVTPEEEWTRLAPVLEKLPQGVRYSMDTRHAETAKRALECGMHWINDVSGFADPAMVNAVRDTDCKLVVMHSLSVPANKNDVLPEGADPVECVLAWAQSRLASLEAGGIARWRLIFDPGIGFGKTAAQSLALLRGVTCFKMLGVPLLIGHSRKSFLAESALSRDEATLELSRELVRQGVDYLRVHDVAAHVRMVRELKHS